MSQTLPTYFPLLFWLTRKTKSTWDVSQTENKTKLLWRLGEVWANSGHPDCRCRGFGNHRHVRLPSQLLSAGGVFRDIQDIPIQSRWEWLVLWASFVRGKGGKASSWLAWADFSRLTYAKIASGSKPSIIFMPPHPNLGKSQCSVSNNCFPAQWLSFGGLPLPPFDDRYQELPDTIPSTTMGPENHQGW
jgi:hypothetical protein